MRGGGTIYFYTSTAASHTASSSAGNSWYIQQYI